MRFARGGRLGIVIVAGLGLSLWWPDSCRSAEGGRPSARGKPAPIAAGLRLSFVEAEGRADRDRTTFHTVTPSGRVSIDDQGVTYRAPAARPAETGDGVIRERFIGAGPLRPRGRQPGPTRLNYFVGAQRLWRRDIVTHRSVDLGEVWPSIRVEMAARRDGVEKIFVVEPGGRVSRISIALQGARSLSIADNGDLLIATGLETMRMTKPSAYQDIDGARAPVSVAYRLEGDVYGFHVGPYDPRHPLVIDPLLVSTFVGATSFEAARTIAKDIHGDIIVAGQVVGSDFLPADWATPGAFDTTVHGSHDVFVAKLTSDLSTVLAVTFIGGTDFDEVHGLGVDSAGNIFISGMTESPDYPVVGGLGTIRRGRFDVFVSKLSNDLSTLSASTLVGGSADENALALAVDAADNVVIAGFTTSSDYPTTPGALDTVFDGEADAFVTKLANTLADPLLASTFLGGSGDEQAEGLVVDGLGNVFVAGLTRSADFPTTASAVDRTLDGPLGDAFISKLASDLSGPLLASTLLGGSSYDAAHAIALDGPGNVIVTGETNSVDFPTTVGAFDVEHNGFGDVFVTQVMPDLSGPVIASTLIGGSSDDRGRALAIDATGHVVVTGETGSSDYPTVRAFDATFNGDVVDGFVSRLVPDFSALAASTFVGGRSIDLPEGVLVDPSDNVFVAGGTFSADFPSTPGGHNPTFSGNGDVFVMKFPADLAPNSPPQAFDDSVITDEDAPVTIAVLSNDLDRDGNPLLVAAVTDGANGTVSINADRTVTYTPAANFHGSDSFTYVASDGAGGADGATVTVQINPVNDAPVAVDDAASTPEDTPVVIDVLSNDHDVEGDPLSISIITAGPSHGTASTNGDGTVTYTPDADFNGSDSFDYFVTDGHGGFDRATVALTVTPVNDPPVADAGRDEVFQVGTTARIDGFRSFDPEGLRLSYTWEQLDGPAMVTLRDPFRLSATRLFEPPLVGAYTFRLTVSDGELTDSDIVVITAVETVLAATLEPAQGPSGTPFTITDPHGRIDPGDLVAFVIPGGNAATHGRLAENVVISPDGTTVSGTVPPLAGGIHYFVTVTPRLEEPSRFQLPSFFVPFRPGEPSIEPTRGPETTPFIIRDPQGRLAFAGAVVFVEFGESPEIGTPVEDFFVSADGTELIGQVPVTVTPSQNFVCVLEQGFFQLFGCLPFLVAFDPVVTINPVIGPPGVTFSIVDPERRLRSGDQVVFYLPESDPATDGVPAGNVVVRDDGLFLFATVPTSLAPERKYFVSVRPTVTGPARFDDLFFAVVEPTEPFISPRLGPVGSRFTITDPDGRIQPGDLALFYQPFTDPATDGVAAVEVDVGSDGQTLTGRVPLGLVEGSSPVDGHTYRVSVRPSASGSPRFGDLFFAVTRARVDITPPQITAPPALTIEGNTAGGATGVSLGTPTVSDDADPEPTVANDAPDLFPLGTTSVTWVATDASGNSATAVQHVTVVDTAAPTLTGLPDSLVAEATSTSGASVAYERPGAEDLVDTAPVVSCSPGPGHTFPLGVTTVNCTASDASGNRATASFTVTVVDTTPPQLTVPADITVVAVDLLTPVEIGTATASDIFPVTVTHDAPAAFEVGTTLVTWTATDANGNTARGAQHIRVVYEFGGFFAPLRSGGVYKLGRVIPVKFQLLFASGTLVSTAQPTIMARRLADEEPIGDPIELTSVSSADVGNQFRYTGDQYIFNLGTAGLSEGYYRLIVDLHDGSAPRTIDVGLR